ncbi:50S ribosomal protein L15 [Candidatus Gottesmanbacteria bacterium]|nr:50S ribosomal protein L15 [Candidatus Gottesmanbacteria bacterium]
MNLSQLPSIVERSKKRVGRGHGSGKVKTAGRGTKGQRARGRVPPGFEGGQLALIKRLPYLRGKGRNKSRLTKSFAISVGKLAAIPKETVVTLEVLRKYHMIDKDVTRVKVVGGSTLSEPIQVALPCSASAKRTIEKVGGKILSE